MYLSKNCVFFLYRMRQKTIPIKIALKYLGKLTFYIIKVAMLLNVKIITCFLHFKINLIYSYNIKIRIIVYILAFFSFHYCLRIICFDKIHPLSPPL